MHWTIHTELKYLTVVSLYGDEQQLGQACSSRLMHLPSVLGNVFSNNRARSGSFNRAFMSDMTFYTKCQSVRNRIESELIILTSTEELLNVLQAGAGRINGNFRGPVEGLPCGDCQYKKC
jgi:hypothetical protein